jgi:sugar O-acyltransferase (sialic acid O-acetyltransferase NeuD family)
MTPCVIFGCGAQARYVIDDLSSQDHAAPHGLVDVEGTAHVGTIISGVPVRWAYEQALRELNPADHRVIVAHGENGLKVRIAAALAQRRFRFLSAVHRQAAVSPTAQVGEGCIVNAGAVVLSNAALERHVIVHSGAVIEHDCVVGEGANIGPGVQLAGRVRVGPAAYLYTGSCVIPGVTIGARAVVGAGAVVLRDVPADARVAGNPARPIGDG